MRLGFGSSKCVRTRMSKGNRQTLHKRESTKTDGEQFEESWNTSISLSAFDGFCSPDWVSCSPFVIFESVGVHVLLPRLLSRRMRMNLALAAETSHCSTPRAAYSSSAQSTSPTVVPIDSPPLLHPRLIPLDPFKPRQWLLSAVLIRIRQHLPPEQPSTKIAPLIHFHTSPDLLLHFTRLRRFYLNLGLIHFQTPRRVTSFCSPPGCADSSSISVCRCVTHTSGHSAAISSASGSDRSRPTYTARRFRNLSVCTVFSQGQYATRRGA